MLKSKQQSPYSSQNLSQKHRNGSETPFGLSKAFLSSTPHLLLQLYFFKSFLHRKYSLTKSRICSFQFVPRRSTQMQIIMLDSELNKQREKLVFKMLNNYKDFNKWSSPPCWWTKTKDLSLAPFVRPPAIVDYIIVISVSGDWLQTIY